jgi:hypothetical protein
VTEALSRYRRIDPDKIIETIRTLHGRIHNRFPDSGLSNVVLELQQVAEETVARTHWIQRPHLPLRIAAAMLILAIAGIAILMATQIRQFQLSDYANFVQSLEASINSVIFITAAIIFLVTWESRIKRNRVLKAIHELRALAHIIDMHQLTKDPESYFSPQRTAALKRAMSPFELNRYLDYCSEALALISKIAALYVQGIQDPVVLGAVDDIEDLTAGFSRKIGQKLTILEMLGRSLAAERS